MHQLTYCQKKVIISVVVLTTVSSVVFGLRYSYNCECHLFKRVLLTTIYDRIYARAFKLKRFGLDDWFMTAAYVSCFLS
jgi:hypothetical protein